MKRLKILPAFTLVVVFLIHFFYICKYAVNIPEHDEWDMLQPDQISQNFDLDWILKKHNEHKIATARLVIWSLYKLEGWDLRHQQILSFLVFGILISYLFYFCRKHVGNLLSKNAFIPAFLVFLLSPLNHENHTFSFNIAFHFNLLFFLIAVDLIIRNKPGFGKLFWGCFAAALSMFSFSAGVAEVLVLVISFAVYTFLQRKPWKDFFIVSGLLLPSFVLWFHDFTPANNAAMTSPTNPNFWAVFANLIALGFGFRDYSSFWGTISFLVLIIPLLYLVFKTIRSRSSDRVSQTVIVTAVFGVLSFIFCIALGRTSYGLQQSKAIRYSEVGMLLVPLTAMLWIFVVPVKRRMKAVSLLWLFFIGGYWDEWYFPAYLNHHWQKKEGQECVKRYIREGGPSQCRFITSSPLDKRIARARELKMSFVKTN